MTLYLCDLLYWLIVMFYFFSLQKTTLRIKVDIYAEFHFLLGILRDHLLTDQSRAQLKEHPIESDT